MSQTARFQETLRRLAIFDEGLAGAGFGPCLAGPAALDGKTVGLLQVAVSVALGSSAVCLQWSTARALAAGATKDEIADVLLAIAPVAGLGRVVSAAPEVATALEYDVEADQLYEELKKILNHTGMAEHHVLGKNFYMDMSIPVAGCAHQAGTCRFGTDPATSVLDVNCKAHELDNLYVVDTSFFPSIGAVNPALTAMANALRVGDHIRGQIAP